MIRTVLALAVSGALGSAGAWLILTDSYPHEGPWVTLTPRHGIHAGDVMIVLLWAAATYGLLRWARARRGARALTRR